MIADSPTTWTEEDSRRYRELAMAAVPAREGQMATLRTLLPFGQDEAFHAVELGCGEGILCSALLECHPPQACPGRDTPAASQHGWRLSHRQAIHLTGACRQWVGLPAAAFVA
jgi:hypothetical protein